MGLFFLSLAVAAQNDCRLRESSSISFTELDSEESIEVVIVGTDLCEEATYTLNIYDGLGNRIYSYSDRFGNHVPFQLEAPELVSFAEIFVDKVLSDSISRDTSNLPVFTNADEYYELTNDWLMVTPHYYENVRKLAQPILWHTTGGGRWHHLIYDRELKSVVVLLSGSVDGLPSDYTVPAH